MAIELGGSITLEGFDGKDFTELIVVKKIVGQYARSITDSHGIAEALRVTLSENGGLQGVRCDLTLGGRRYESESSAHNLYVALDDALKGLVKQLS